MADKIVDEYKARQRCRPPRKTWRPKFWQDVSLRGFSCTWITIINPNVWLDRILLSRAARVRRSFPSLSHSSITPLHTPSRTHTLPHTHPPSHTHHLPPFLSRFFCKKDEARLGHAAPRTSRRKRFSVILNPCLFLQVFFSSENSIRKRANLWRTLLTR